MTAHLAHAFRWQICHLPKFVGGNWSTWRKPMRTSTLVPTKAYNRSPDPGAVSHKCFLTANFFLHISTSNVNDVCKQWGNSCPDSPLNYIGYCWEDPSLHDPQCQLWEHADVSIHNVSFLFLDIILQGVLIFLNWETRRKVQYVLIGVLVLLLPACDPPVTFHEL